MFSADIRSWHTDCFNNSRSRLNAKSFFKNKPGENIELIESRVFVFEVIFNHSFRFDGELDRSCVNARSVIVEVDVEGIAEASGNNDADAAVRHSAEEVALQAAMQTIEKDLPHGFEPAFSVAQIDYLPDELRRRSPTLHLYQVCAWVI